MVASERTVYGLGGVFGNKDLDGDIIVPSAFKKQFKGRTLDRIKGLWQHDWHEPIGLNKVNNTSEGLETALKIGTGTEATNKAFNLTDQGIITDFSIGFIIPKGGAHFDSKLDAFIIEEAILKEISLVTFGANPLAKVYEVKTQADVNDVIESMGSFLREKGYSANMVSKALSGNLCSLIQSVDADKEEQMLDILAHIKQLKNT